jgi:hypothetical protein
MKIVELILKGVLLWLTALSTMVFITGIDSLVENSILFMILYLLSDIALIWLCCNIISKQEFDIISGTNLFNKFF